MFTRRHYELIARAINRTPRSEEGEILGSYLVANLVAMFEANNARFDTAKFLEACRS